MYDLGKSDGFVVPAKFPNNAGSAVPLRREMEGRNPAKGNLAAAKRVRTPRRIHPPKRAKASAAGGENRLRVLPEARARCGNSARRDPCGGRRATAVPTATAPAKPVRCSE